MSEFEKVKKEFLEFSEAILTPSGARSQQTRIGPDKGSVITRLTPSAAKPEKDKK